MSEAPLPRSSAPPSHANVDDTVQLPSPTEATANASGRPEPPLPLVPGQRVLGRYALVSALGQGGMAVVWRARDVTLGETVALKFLPEAVARDGAAVEALKEETRRAHRLTHPHIVRIHDFVQDATMAAVSMEYVDGTTLANLRLQQPGRVFSVEALAPFVAQLCAALDYAHTNARLVHRDLKPANLLVTRDGQLKIADFGIARGLSEASTRLTGRAVGRSSGTFLHASPQQLSGEQPSEADDIYAVGATLYEMLTGKPPFFRGDLHSLSGQIRESVPPGVTERRAELKITGEAVPREWEHAIHACLAKQPQDRPRSARELAQRLGLAEAAPQAPRATRPSAPVAEPAESVLESYPIGGRAPSSPWGPVDYFVAGALVSGLAAYVAGFTPLPRPWKDNPALERRVSRLFGTEKAGFELRARPGTIVTGTDARGKHHDVGTVGPDGRLAMRRPLAVGRYTLRLRHPECADLELPNLQLTGEAAKELAPVQVPLPGELRVFSVPSDAEVWLNGKRAGRTPATLRQQPSEQPLQVEVVARGYRKAGQTLTLRPREVKVLNLGTLEATSSGIRFRNLPAGFAMEHARVMVDGIEMRPTREGNEWRFDGLAEGVRELEIVSPDFEVWKGTATLVDRETAAVDVRPRRRPAPAR